MPFWNLHKKYQLPTTNVHWDRTLQSWLFLIGGGNHLPIVQCIVMVDKDICKSLVVVDVWLWLGLYHPGLYPPKVPFFSKGPSMWTFMARCSAHLESLFGTMFVHSRVGPLPFDPRCSIKARFGALPGRRPRSDRKRRLTQYYQLTSDTWNWSQTIWHLLT